MISGRRETPWTLLRIAVAAAMAGPLLWAAWASLQPVEAIFAAPGGATSNDRPIDGQPPVARLRWNNYVTALTRLPLTRFLLNSSLITVVATVGAVFTSSMVGFAFARLRWRGRRLWFGVLLATMMLPTQVLLIPQFLIYQQLGWVHTYKPLIIPSWLGGSAFFIFLFRQFFKGIARDYEDAARLDGASNWQLYWHVMLPMARPVIGAVAALAAVSHWQAFIEPLIYLSDFHTYPVSVGLRMYQATEGVWPNLIMAASLIALVPPLIVLLFAQKHLMRSIGVR